MSTECRRIGKEQACRSPSHTCFLAMRMPVPTAHVASPMLPWPDTPSSPCAQMLIPCGIPPKKEEEVEEEGEEEKDE